MSISSVQVRKRVFAAEVHGKVVWACTAMFLQKAGGRDPSPGHFSALNQNAQTRTFHMPFPTPLPPINSFNDLSLSQKMRTPFFQLFRAKIWRPSLPALSPAPCTILRGADYPESVPAAHSPAALWVYAAARCAFLIKITSAWSLCFHASTLNKHFLNKTY